MGLFDGIKFPYLNMQELNLDWIMTRIKELMGFMPTDGDVGDILTRKSDGASWEPPSAVQVDIDGLPEDTQIMNNDQLIFYDISAQANRKIKPPNLLDSMCSNAYPLMDGTAAAGTSNKPARYDHVHPTDTSRAPATYFQNGNLKLDHGGTGADNAADARDNLGLGNVATEDIVPVGKGGSGADNASDARDNFGVKSGSWAGIVLPHTVTEDSIVRVKIDPTDANPAYILIDDGTSTDIRLNAFSGYAEINDFFVKKGTTLSVSSSANCNATVIICPLYT